MDLKNDSERGSGKKRKSAEVTKDGPTGVGSLKPEMVPNEGPSNIQ